MATAAPLDSVASDQETDQLLQQYDIPSVIPKVPTGYERRREYEKKRRNDLNYGTYLSMKNSGDFTEDDSIIDNPTTRALFMCNEMVLKPYRKLLLTVGWQPVFDDPIQCWQKMVNIIHPLIVVIFVVVGYVIQYAACFRRDSSTFHGPSGLVPVVDNSSNATDPSEFYEECQRFIVSQYIIPDVLHSMAYLYSFYLLRISDREQLPRLMERVFLQTSPTESGFLSQGSLIRTMRAILYMGIIWVFFSLTAQILHVIGSYKTTTIFGMTDDTLGKISVMVLMLVGFVALDVVYTTVVITYTVQVALLIFYTEGLKEKLKQRNLDLMRAIREMGEIKGHMYTLNYRTALAVSIVLFNFGTMAVLGTVSFFGGKANNFSLIMYIGTALSVALWLAIMFMPIIQAARLTAACNSLKNIGHELRTRPFGYQDVPNEELDSFLLYTSSLDMKAKLFLVPVKTSYMMLILAVSCFVLLLLFQSGAISIWL